MLRSLLLLSALTGLAHCLTCSTSATVSNGVNSNGTLLNTTKIDLATVTCPSTLDRCMTFTSTNLADVLALNAATAQTNLTMPLQPFRNATLTGLTCASQADCVKMKTTNSTSCLNSAVSCCCTGDLCSTKAASSQLFMGSIALMMVAMVALTY